jgi:putative SOS response-associated peptidase YedK
VQPLYVRMKDEQPFAFAGLWEHWQGERGDAIQSCTLLTTEPNALIRSFHHRMPVIVGPGHYDLWLDPAQQDPAAVQPLLRSYPAEGMTAYPISTLVNNPRNDIPECIAPLPAGQDRESLSDA